MKISCYNLYDCTNNSNSEEEKMKKTLFTQLMVVLLFLVFTGVAFATSDKEEAGEGPTYRFTMIIYGTPGNPFWKKVIMGTNEAADTLGVDVDIQFAENDPEKQNNILETAITNRVDGIGCILNLPDAYDKNVRRARQAGIPLVVYNIDDPMGAEGNDRMAYIGQDFVVAGYTLAKEVIKSGNLRRGDHVVSPVEHPEATYAKKRFEGIKMALDEIGATAEVLDTGAIGVEDTLNKVTQYLLGHSETDAIIAAGLMACQVAPQAVEDAGMDIPGTRIGGFDISVEIIQSILNGEIQCTIDQQPYYQGAFTVMQLYLNNKYGLVPCSINTGAAVIDKSNAAIILEFADTHR
jgi:simple sugar transport system substrate-binding protein